MKDGATDLPNANVAARVNAVVYGVVETSEPREFLASSSASRRRRRSVA
jgi:hypothetical protein